MTQYLVNHEGIQKKVFFLVSSLFFYFSIRFYLENPIRLSTLTYLQVL
ncbi:hypothetical protein Halhy_3451 [Haliscomenobacter hydrossis DSM 1100]|uniref:Uncharacterized protein n=1 Tax=Haliscomenobacter hydrossis (strain ATCC 27775 / DSM 1100 / LMG 10767 / O) TaxID=760192 RepID=F4KVJ4_HALH1|nr:hypothetical protein Halhy_3451 [Haliscomenobacter hydrossis DSM 1100]